MALYQAYPTHLPLAPRELLAKSFHRLEGVKPLMNMAANQHINVAERALQKA
jgi:hypothetical protein